MCLELLHPPSARTTSHTHTHTHMYTRTHLSLSLSLSDALSFFTRHTYHPLYSPFLFRRCIATAAYDSLLYRTRFVEKSDARHVYICTYTLIVTRHTRPQSHVPDVRDSDMWYSDIYRHSTLNQLGAFKLTKQLVCSPSD